MSLRIANMKSVINSSVKTSESVSSNKKKRKSDM